MKLGECLLWSKTSRFQGEQSKYCKGKSGKDHICRGPPEFGKLFESTTTNFATTILMVVMEKRRVYKAALMESSVAF